MRPFSDPRRVRAWEVARTVVAPPSSVVKCLWEVFVGGWGVVLVVCVCVLVSGVLFPVGVCVCVTCWSFWPATRVWPTGHQTRSGDFSDRIHLYFIGYYIWIQPLFWPATRVWPAGHHHIYRAYHLPHPGKYPPAPIVFLYYELALMVNHRKLYSEAASFWTRDVFMAYRTPHQERRLQRPRRSMVWFAMYFMFNHTILYGCGLFFDPRLDLYKIFVYF